MTRIGIVIPTLFERPQYLLRAISSIREAGDAYILLSGPENQRLLENYSELVDEFQIEQKSGNLASKINHALMALPAQCEFITWLGDDDLLTPQSLVRSASALDQNPDVGLVYGACDYIDDSGDKIGQNPSGNWAPMLAQFGPFLIPQPGALWRRSTFEAVGGIDAKFCLAFDHDLYLRLHKKSRSLYLSSTQACFRWHRDSLSVKARWSSVIEASRVRRKHYAPVLKWVLIPWEFVVVLLTRFAGVVVTVLAKYRSR